MVFSSYARCSVVCLRGLSLSGFHRSDLEGLGSAGQRILCKARHNSGHEDEPSAMSVAGEELRFLGPAQGELAQNIATPAVRW